MRFIVFFFDFMLEEHFRTKRKMAHVLEIDLRTLQYNFRNIAIGKGGCIAIPYLLTYCCENGISIDRIYERYVACGSEKKGVAKIMDRDGILGWLYRYTLKELFDSDIRTMAIELRVSERNLQRAMEKENDVESVLLFERLMQYCMEHHISMDAILSMYVDKSPE